jgi:coenzyme F420-reducing hydrogenase delta subunit
VDASALKLECHSQGMGAATFVSLPCSGKISLSHLLKTLENGADAVFLLTCPESECRFLEGSSRAGKRVEAVAALLAEAGMERCGIRVLRVPGRAGMEPAVSALVRHLDDMTVPECETV